MKLEMMCYCGKAMLKRTGLWFFFNLIFICLFITCSFASDKWGTMYEQVIPSSASANLDLHLDPSGSQTITDSEKLIIVAYPSCADCTPEYYWKATGGDIIGQPNTRKITWRPPDVSDTTVFYIYCTLQDGKGHNIKDFVQVIVTDSGEPPCIDPDSDYIDPIVSIVTVTSRNLIVNQPATIIWNATDNQTADEQLSIQIEHLRPDGSGWDVVNSNTPNTGSIIWTPTETGTDLRVRVCATDADGNQSAWVESDVFDVIAQGSNPTNCSGDPEAPNLYDPGISTPNNWFDLSWRKIGDATSYVLQESESLSFDAATEQTFSGTDNCTASFTNKANGIYYYRVKSVNRCGESDWSAPVDIEVKVHSAPLPPINPSPADNATNISLTPTLIWDERDSDADSNPLDYYVVLGTDPNAMYTKRAYGSVGSIYPTITNPLKPATTYYWQVTVRDRQNVSTQGPIWCFITAGLFPDLEISSFSVDGEIKNESTITATVVITNIGQYATTLSPSLRFFQSTSENSEEKEYSYDWNTIHGLQVGESQTIIEQIQLNGIVNGTNYLVAKIDNGGLFTESSLANNVSSFRMEYIDAQSPDIEYFELQWAQNGTYRRNTSRNIVYNVFDDTPGLHVDIFFSANNGNDWTPIALNVAMKNGGHEFYPWVIPSDIPLTDSFKLRIVANDASGNSSENIIGPYTILDHTPAAITITSPNSGDVLDLEKTYNISWENTTATDLLRVVIWYVNGPNDSVIAGLNSITNPDINTGTSYAYSWTIPLNIGVSSAAKLRFNITDANLNEFQIESDTFTVRDASPGPSLPWHLPEMITNNPNASVESPTIIADSGDNLHLVYRSFNINGIGTVCYRKRTHDSDTWSTPQVVTSAVFFPYLKMVIDLSDNPHLIWASERSATDNGEIWYSRLSGGVWTNPISISNNSTYSFEPDIVADSNDNLHVVWTDGRTKNSEGRTIAGMDTIYYSKRNSMGIWSVPAAIGLPETAMPYVGLAPNDSVFVGYFSHATGSFNVINKQGVGSWSQPYELSSNWIYYCDFKYDGEGKTHVICASPDRAEYFVFNGINWTAAVLASTLKRFYFPD